MKIPKPLPGLVVSYRFLWKREHDRGLLEGMKDRPCAIIVATSDDDVIMAPITHTPPRVLGTAIEIPLKVKQDLGLDDQQSWIVLNELNRFKWPGFDLRPIPGDSDRCFYGMIPAPLYRAVRDGILELDAAVRSPVDRN